VTGAPTDRLQINVQVWESPESDPLWLAHWKIDDIDWIR
jgi:hypothetical protein